MGTARGELSQSWLIAYVSIIGNIGDEIFEFSKWLNKQGKIFKTATVLKL